MVEEFICKSLVDQVPVSHAFQIGYSLHTVHGLNNLRASMNSGKSLGWKHNLLPTRIVSTKTLAPTPPPWAWVLSARRNTPPVAFPYGNAFFCATLPTSLRNALLPATDIHLLSDSLNPSDAVTTSKAFDWPQLHLTHILHRHSIIAIPWSSPC